jgi:bifunctional non-homologous end joining protein LigD
VALEEYRKKRDFRRTPEPEGKVARSTGRARFFCVQKHLASHLHYDLRLEHDGVLLSWAVPKGPSLDPKTKRLAMKVEDHPLAYGEFEGVIPEGYGAGIVMLWDHGSWKPEASDVNGALQKGDLKFTLDGYKLKGSWVLVRTSGRYAGAAAGQGPSRTWLLIKHRDEWSSSELDITEFAPRSVKSDGDFEDILGADTPDVWLSGKPSKGGAAGAMLASVIERASAQKGARAAAPAKPRRASPAKRRPTRTSRSTQKKPRKKQNKK